MTRLPIPGGDDGNWGTILNSFLEVSHASDGTLNPNVVGSAQLQDNSVGATQIQDNAVTNTQLDSAIQTNLDLAASSVQSVNSQLPGGSGAVTLAPTDIGAAPLDSPAFTGTPTKAGSPLLSQADGDATYVAQANLPSAVSGVIGAVIVVSDTAPTDTSLNGVPVLWVNPAEQLVTVPVYPTSPTWDDAATTYTLPSGLIGVDYYNGPTLLTQGQTYDGTQNEITIITTQAQNGYLLPSLYTFEHAFPDPSDVTLLYSDGFTGTNGATLDGRTMDATLGGSTLAYQGTGGFFEIENGTAVTTGNDGGQGGYSLTVGQDYHKVVWNVVSMVPGSGFSSIDTMIIIGVGGDAINSGALVEIGPDRLRVQYSSTAGNTDLLFNYDPSTVVGTWSAQIYADTFTLIAPDGTTWDWYLGGLTPAWSGGGDVVTIRSTNSSSNNYGTATISNLLIYQIG